MDFSTFCLALNGSRHFPWHSMPISPVPPKSPCQVHATFTPHTQQTINRFPLLLSQDTWNTLVLMWLDNFANDASSMVHLRSSPWHIPCQPKGRLSIVVPLLICFHQSSTKWFAVSTCIPNAVGQPPSLWKLRQKSIEYSQYHTSSCLRTHFMLQSYVFLSVIIQCDNCHQQYNQSFHNSNFVYIMVTLFLLDTYHFHQKW